MMIEYEWYFQAEASMKTTLERKIRIDLSKFDELQPCHAGPVKVAT